jgi:catechol 2,3-dioxygenase-like lactoylglutathione lyase family enzyme
MKARGAHQDFLTLGKDADPVGSCDFCGQLHRSGTLQLDRPRRQRVTLETKPLIMGVAEIVLNVRDLPAMRDFYRTILGFELLSEACHETGPEPDPEGMPTIAFLTVKALDTPLGRHGHPQLLALIDFRRHIFAKGHFVGHEPSHSTLNHLAFEIPPESYEAHKQRLEALGLSPREAKFPAMAARALFFNDPERNVLELICHVGSEG